MNGGAPWFVTLIATVLALGLVSCGDDGDATTPAPTAADSGDSPERISGNTFGIGERVVVVGPDMIVEGFERSTDPDDISDEFRTFELESGDEYLILTIRVINDTDKPAGIRSSELSLLSRGESISGALTTVLGARDALDADVLPAGGQATGLVVWSAVQGFDELALLYTPDGNGRRYLVVLEGDMAERPPEPTRPKPDDLASDEEDIGEAVDDYAKAFSREDWSDVYDLLPPSERETCLKGRYLSTVNVAVEFGKGFIGEEAWEALKEDASDGFEVQSIDVTGDRAIVFSLEAPEGTVAVKEEGKWWILGDVGEEGPCEFSFD